MKRRLLPILMTLVLVCALPIWAAFVTSGDVTNPLVSTAAATSPPDNAATRLKSAISNGGTVQLTEDIEISKTLLVTRDVTLDLNGCTLRMTGTGSVLKVSGRATLTITDSSAAKSGTITGGNAEDGDGGGVCVEAYATLEMTGGCITGCRAEDGGGVYIDNNATLKMTGGCITGCYAKWGGGIFLDGTLYMSGTARIADCTAGTETTDAIYNRNSGSLLYADGGTVDGMVNNQGTIRRSEGAADVTVFNGTVYNRAKKIIEDGIYKGTVENTGTITGGTFYDAVTNRKASLSFMTEAGTISGGTFYGSIVNEGGPEQVADSAKVAVTFNTDGGTSVAEEKVLRGQKMSKPAAPTKSGYTFTGWEDANGAYDFNTPVTAPLTLTAKWEKVPSSGGYYYYPTTDTKADDAKDSPKTADPGVALYGVLSLLSLTGLTCTAKKR